MMKREIIKKSIVLTLIALLAVVSIIGTGCGQAKEPVDEVSVQLKWYHQANAAGMYAAAQNGFYSENNINAAFVEGGSDITLDDRIAALITGETSFAVISSEQVLMLRAEDIPVVAIAVIFQRNPYTYASLKTSGITKPEHLAGKKVMITMNAWYLHAAMLKKNGISPDAIEIIPFERSLEPLASGAIDAHLVYGSSLGVAFTEAGYDISKMWLDDWGIHVPGDTIVTTEQLIRQNPELIDRFLSATLSGWQYSIENIDATADMTLKYDESLDRTHQINMMRAQIPLIHTGATPIGWMEDSKWQQTHDILLDDGLITRPIDISKAYTMQFLNKIYTVTE